MEELMARLWEKSGRKPLGVAHGAFRPFLVNFALRDILKNPPAKSVAIFAAPGGNAEH